MAKIPESIDKYKIEGLIASGGMGAVFKGIHPTLKRPVILKKLTIRGSASIAERFRREARILMDFKNDNIVDVHDHFKSGSTHYIVMEFVDGISLQGMIEQHRYLDNASAAFILLETAKALSYAHDRKVVHRDIKPANILISKTGEVKLADFGIASSRSDNDENETLTKEGMTLGTPSYMAPEQFDSTRSVDNRADIYSLGVMLYEMVTGKKPFPGGFSHELVLAIKKGKYKSPKKLNPHLSGFLFSMLKKLMKANMSGRVKDLKDVIPSLERYVASFDPEELQQRIISLVKNRKSAPVKPRKQPWLVRTLSIGIPGALILGLIVLYGFISGFPLRFFAGRDYGEVQFTLDLKDYYKAMGDTSITTSLFIDDNSTIPDYPYDPIFFPNMFSEEQKLMSIPFHLPSGHYRAKTVVDDYVFWQSFYVASWEAQGEATKVLQIIKPEPVYNVETRFNVSNALTGGLINGATVSVFFGGAFSECGFCGKPGLGPAVHLPCGSPRFCESGFCPFYRPSPTQFNPQRPVGPLPRIVESDP
jgi:serine/threonine protein kinase